jgi:hypothetical protein
MVSWLEPAVAHAYSFNETAEGTPTHWAQDAIDVVVDRSISAIDPHAMEAVIAAFDTWQGSGAPLPTINLVFGDADPVGYRQGEENHSTVRYARHGYPPAKGALAITELTFDDNGAILDADIVLNGGPERPFGLLGDSEGDDSSAARSKVDYDFQNVTTHEIGHFFGLGEERVDHQATMFITSARGETKKRTLDANDESGIHALYNGADTTAASGCSAAGQTGGGSSSHPLLIAAALALGAAARRKQTSAA